MSQTGIYRKLLTNFLPVMVGCTVANVFELTKIIQMNPVGKVLASGDRAGFTDSLVEIIKYRRASHGIMLTFGMLGALTFFEEFYSEVAKRSYFAYYADEKMTSLKEVGFKTFGTLYSLWWIYPIDKFRTLWY